MCVCELCDICAAGGWDGGGNPLSCYSLMVSLVSACGVQAPRTHAANNFKVQPPPSILGIPNKWEFTICHLDTLV